jgi:hypothetical protein
MISQFRVTGYTFLQKFVTHKSIIFQTKIIVFEKRALRKIFGHKREEVTGG